MTETIVVFAGPSLPPEVRPADPRLDWRGPAAAGDAVRLAAVPPRAVALIDGLFDQHPAIRHKELLELIALGVTVIGAASQGALRAAELQAFGMIGVGRIFAAFAKGRLVSDDEVAVLHGPADYGWRALTEPLVNVRATLARAARARVIGAPAARRVIEAARRIHYAERAWPGVLRAAGDGGDLAAAEVEALRAWLPAGRVDLKRADALAGVDHALSLGPGPPPARPFPPRTVFSDALAAAVTGERL